jgi:5'-3' exonuclease
MDVYLIDGTYELFRHFFAVPAAADVDGQEIGAVRGVLTSVLSMIERGATCLGVATDHVVESFRNNLYPGYKTSEGVAPELLSQFPILEEALAAMGVVVWPMVEFEADDALASAASKAANDDRVQKVLICTPDKDLSQCVVGTRVVQLDRRSNVVRDEAGVVAKFGVGPQSISDFLAVVGDSADGFPGVRGWGVKAAALTLSQYPHLEDIPKDWRNGIRPFAKPACCPNRCSTRGTTHCCSAPLQPCGWMCLSLIRSTICAGRYRGPSLRNAAGG